MALQAATTSSPLWGLHQRNKHRQAPPKCFNIASRVQRGGLEQALSCRVHPVAVLKILDGYARRPKEAPRIIGTLLGWISEGSVVDITDSFPVIHKDNNDGAVFMDQDYHKQMLSLKQQLSPREVVVGWFSVGSGDSVTATSAVVHAFYCTKESQFSATAVLPSPVHMTIDTTMAQKSLGIKAWVNVRTVVAESLLQFHEVPVHVQTSAAEKSGITQLMQARRSRMTDIASQDGFQGGLKELLGLFRRMQEYVRAVVEGRARGDLAVGRGLTAALCAEPVIDTEAVEKLCRNSLEDSLMVVYLSNLTRTQIALAEKINLQYSVEAS